MVPRARQAALESAGLGLRRRLEHPLPADGGGRLARDPAARRPATGLLLTLYSLQLAVNLAWSWLFFGAHSAGWALADITLVVLLVAATTVAFARVSRLAGRLFMPYLAWVAFAWTINFWIVVRS